MSWRKLLDASRNSYSAVSLKAAMTFMVDWQTCLSRERTHCRDCTPPDFPEVLSKFGKQLMLGGRSAHNSPRTAANRCRFRAD